MRMAALLLIQAATPAAPIEPRAAAEGAGELGFTVTPERGCAGSEAGEIVVCGSRRDKERYRLRPLPQQYERQPGNAEIQLMEGVTGGIHVEGAALPNGMISKRIMVRVKVRF